MRNRLLISCLLIGGFASQAAHAQTAPAQSSLLILPFSATAAGSEWVGRAVQQDLLTDLTQGTIARVTAPSGAAPAADAEAATRAAQNAGASIVVYGQAQTAGKDVRLTGQVLDVATGKPLGQLKATGPADDLFHLEDGLAGQVLTALPRTLLTAQALQGMQQQASGTTPNQNQTTQMPRILSDDTAPVGSNTGVATTTSGYAPAQYYVPTYSTESYPTTVYYNTYYPSYYPAYGYSYPTWGWWPWSVGFVFTSNFGYCHNWSPCSSNRFFGGGHGWTGGVHNWSQNGSGFHNGQSTFHAGTGNQFAGGTGFNHSGARFTPTARSGVSGLNVSRGGSVATGFPRMSTGSIGTIHSGGGFSPAGHVGGMSAGGGFHGGMSAGAAHGSVGGAGGGGHR